MRKLSAKRRLIGLFTIILLSSLYLQAAYAAPATQNTRYAHGAGSMQSNSGINRDLSILAHKILLLEYEIRIIKKQQERIENLSHEILKLEQNLKALRNYIKQNARQEKHPSVTFNSDPEVSKINFFVPAGW